jgi:putative ABC transport system permease protein
MILKIVWRNILAKKLNSLLCILLMTFGIFIISLLLNVSKQLEQKFAKNISGIDMVVGAKGSPLQLILSGVYHIDSPTGNIPLSEITKLSSNPLIKSIIPMSMGDNYAGSRIIGTNKKYLDHYKAELAEGHFFNKSLEVVIGSDVAKKQKLNLGSVFTSSHGLEKDGEKHEAKKFKVCGILKHNNSVLDNLIVGNLQSVWEVHDHENHANETLINGEEQNTEPNLEITCAIVKFRSPMGLMTIPRNINQNTKMQAALPAIEINRLFELMGIGLNAIKALALAIMIISGLSVFVTLFNALKERKYEMALMLSMGASRLKLFLMLLLEGLIISVLGYFLGILFSRIGLIISSKIMNEKFNYSFESVQILPEEIFLLIAALLVGIFAAIIPSLGVYKINITKTLANE